MPAITLSNDPAISLGDLHTTIIEEQTPPYAPPTVFKVGVLATSFDTVVVAGQAIIAGDDLTALVADSELGFIETAFVGTVYLHTVEAAATAPERQAVLDLMEELYGQIVILMPFDAGLQYTSPARKVAYYFADYQGSSSELVDRLRTSPFCSMPDIAYAVGVTRPLGQLLWSLTRLVASYPSLVMPGTIYNADFYGATSKSQATQLEEAGVSFYFVGTTGTQLHGWFIGGEQAIVFYAEQVVRHEMQETSVRNLNVNYTDESLATHDQALNTRLGQLVDLGTIRAFKPTRTPPVKSQSSSNIAAGRSAGTKVQYRYTTEWRTIELTLAGQY